MLSTSLTVFENIWRAQVVLQLPVGPVVFHEAPANSVIIIVDSCLVRNLLISHAIFYFIDD